MCYTAVNMGLESFPSSTSGENNEERQSAEQAESSDVEVNSDEDQFESTNEKPVGKNAYVDSSGFEHTTYPIREKLDQKTLEKLEKMKEQQIAEDDAEDQAKAA